MIITIDTTKDSKEDILAAAKILNELGGRPQSSSYSYDEPDSKTDPVSSEGAAAFGAMFGDDNTNYGLNDLDEDDNPPKEEEPSPNPSPNVEILTY